MLTTKRMASPTVKCYTPTFLSRRPRGHYVSKLPRRRNSRISRAIQAAVHEQRRILRRQQRVEQIRQREIGHQRIQEERQAAVVAATQEAERLLQAILAERASKEAAKKQQKEQSPAQSKEELVNTNKEQNQVLHPTS
ncbi:hypothetical protein OUZ56_010294 [Daphnia magna]|uniref:Uncharacterized protein n=1 Tax=Daphnia magna TaxID=35525 RepID=A0ABR0AI58_9CRUS|nr:hypothetical protein OUZ56_010294 [Daphnia magna]